MASQEIYKQERKGVGGRVKDAALWAGEKSVYVTLPLTGVLFVAGALPAATALTLGALDVGGSLVLKNIRNKEKQNVGKSGVVYQA